MDVQVAEARGEACLLGRLQRLVAEEQDLVLQQGLFDRAVLGVVEGMAEVDAGDYGAEGGA
ncbi:hypothetical protein D3C80_2020950 [compost metagenome]